MPFDSREYSPSLCLEKIPTAFALKELTAAEEARIIVLIKKAVG